jgi:hypothetical protein
MVATAAPGYPATASPTKVAVRTTGPGVTWPSATPSRNVVVLIQPREMTSWNISGNDVKPPPNANMSMRAMRVPSSNSSGDVAARIAKPTTTAALMMSSGRVVERGCRGRLKVGGLLARPEGDRDHARRDDDENRVDLQCQRAAGADGDDDVPPVPK